MDSNDFYYLVRLLRALGTRRRFLTLVPGLPMGGSAITLLGDETADAQGRRKRRKKRHKHGRHKKKRCKPNSTARTCAGTCGPVKNNCEKIVDCGLCTCDPACPVCFICQDGLDTPGTCVVDAGHVGEPCGPCATCDGAGQCVSCDSGLDCCGESCVDLRSDPAHCGECATACPHDHVCQDGGCAVGCGSDVCPVATEICDGGTCQACTVCARGCPHTTVQAAIDDPTIPSGGTIRICAGTYFGTVTVNKNLTLIGKGDGTLPASSTILDAGNRGQVVVIPSGRTVTLTGLRITSGLSAVGAGIDNAGILTMSSCTVTENTAENIGGGGIQNRGTLTMTNCTVSLNESEGEGGGIGNHGSLTLTNCAVSNNSVGLSGAGIFNASGKTVTLNGSSVTDNASWHSPAGIDNSSGGTVNLTDGSTVSGNTPGNCGGGGIFNGSGCA